MIEAAFVFTAAMAVMALFRLIPLAWGAGVRLPPVVPFTSLTPDHYLILYPSVIFQVWFWTHHLGLFV